jgi:hypothetical protein
MKKVSFLKRSPQPPKGVVCVFSLLFSLPADQPKNKIITLKALFLSKTTTVMSILARAHYAREMGSNYEVFNTNYEVFNTFFRTKYEEFNTFNEKRFCFSYLITIFAKTIYIAYEME